MEYPQVDQWASDVRTNKRIYSFIYLFILRQQKMSANLKQSKNNFSGFSNDEIQKICNKSNNQEIGKKFYLLVDSFQFKIT